MWDSYGRNEGNQVGVCIKTNAQKLYNSIIDCKVISSGVKRYKEEFEPTIGNTFADCFVKNSRFDGERELRLWYISEKFYDTAISNIPESGINVSIDPKILIDEVIINPRCNDEDIQIINSRIGNIISHLGLHLVPSKIKYAPRTSV